MNISHTGSREEWLAARLGLLAKEKAASRQLAVLAEQRRALPAVAVDKDYVFEGPDGKVALIDLFEGRSQLIVYHFMWLHDIDEGCPSCSFAVDDMPDPVHLNEGAHTTLALVSRVPYTRLSQFKARMGWRLPWYSSHGKHLQLRLPRQQRRVDRTGRIQLQGQTHPGAQGARVRGDQRNRRARRERLRPGWRQGVSHLFGLRCGCRCHAEHLPVPRCDSAGPAALHQPMAMARQLWGTGSS